MNNSTKRTLVNVFILVAGVVCYSGLFIAGGLVMAGVVKHVPAPIGGLFWVLVVTGIIDDYFRYRRGQRLSKGFERRRNSF